MSESLEPGDGAAALSDAAFRPLLQTTDGDNRLRLALDAGQMAIWSVDAAGNVEVSPEFRRLLKLPEHGQPTLQELLARYYPGELDRVLKIVNETFAKGERYAEWEYRHLWPNDEVRWLLVRAELLRDEAGERAGSIGVIMDITERKQVEEDRQRVEAELRESESRLRIAQAAGQIGSFELLSETHRLRVSEEFCRLWGLEPVDEAPLSAFLDRVHPEDSARLQTWRTDLPDGALEYVQYRIRRADTGELRWLARRGESVRDPATGQVRHFGVAYDITERVAQQQRQQFLLDLNDELRGFEGGRDIIRTAQRMLGQYLGANRVGYGEVDASERYFTTTDNWTASVPPRQGVHDLAGFGPQIHEALKRGQPLFLDDVVEDPRTNNPVAIAAFEAIDTRAAITASLVVGGRMVAALYVHSQEPRRWTAADVQLVQEVAQRTWVELARVRAEEQARASEERYRRIFQQTSDPIITANLEQIITDANQAAAEAVGLTVEEAIGRHISDFLSVEDLALSNDMLRKKMERGGTTRYDVRVRGAGGRVLFWEVNSGLTFDDQGQPVGLHVVARDVTERKQWERHQALLVAELNHRVKNTLAVVQSLAHQSFRRSDNPAEAISAYEGRLNALALAHNLLTRENWDSADIGEVLRQALLPFCSDHRCHFEGPAWRVEPRIAVSLTLAVHELATNASKYGALSNDKGGVHVSWRAGGTTLEIVWREVGGPEVQAPTREGFGTRMLRRALAQDLKGDVDLAFEPAGLVCRISAAADQQSVKSAA